jgi:hypothetical protein
MGLLAGDLLTGKVDALVKDRQPRVHRVPRASRYRLSTQRAIKLISRQSFPLTFPTRRKHRTQAGALSFYAAIQDGSIPKYITRNRSRLRQRESCEVRFWETHAGRAISAASGAICETQAP